MCLCVRVPSSYHKTYIPHVFISFYLFIYTLYIHVRVCVFDRAAWTTGSTLDLKLARFLREACPFVWICADFFPLIIDVYILVCLRRTGLEHET